MEYDNAPITLADGCWVAARATVLRGVTVGAGAVVGATALVHRDVAPGLASPRTGGGDPDVRILHVATLVSPDAAFGGPLRVAINQCTELRNRGHDVQLLGGARGAVLSGPDCSWEGIPAQLFPVHRVLPGLGFSGIASPGLLRWAWRHIEEFDVVHVHLARDLISMPIAQLALRRSVPLVVQPHGMVNPSERRLAAMLDLLMTRRILQSADRTFALTRFEQTALVEVARSELPSMRLLANGTPTVEYPVPGPAQPVPPDVLFVARLHARKRPEAFVRMAQVMVEAGSNASFSIAGPDEGCLPSVLRLIRDLGLEERVAYEGPLDFSSAASRLARASVYVLPSVDEPFPMTVLEALSQGVPVVCTESNGLAAALGDSGSGIITDGTPSALADATTAILEEPGRAQRMAASGRLLIATEVRDLCGRERSRSRIRASREQRTSLDRDPMVERPTRQRNVLWLTNIPTPYRLPVWREFNATTNLVIGFQAEIRAEPQLGSGRRTCADRTPLSRWSCLWWRRDAVVPSEPVIDSTCYASANGT